MQLLDADILTIEVEAMGKAQHPATSNIASHDAAIQPSDHLTTANSPGIQRHPAAPDMGDVLCVVCEMMVLTSD